jgi:hypothetical protein
MCIGFYSFRQRFYEKYRKILQELGLARSKNGGGWNLGKKCAIEFSNFIAIKFPGCTGKIQVYVI